MSSQHVFDTSLKQRSQLVLRRWSRQGQKRLRAQTAHDAPRNAHCEHTKHTHGHADMHASALKSSERLEVWGFVTLKWCNLEFVEI